MIKAESNPETQILSQSCPEVNCKPVKRHQHRHNVKSRYGFLQTLGKGTYGKVKLAKHKDTRKLVAVKTIRKDKIKDLSDMKHIRREIEIMASIQHENIIQIHEVFENQDKIVIVMEYASGGELYNYLEAKRGITSDEAKYFFKQIVSAVKYCHKMGIVHRDLKLENILLSEDMQIKIADFGLANTYKKDALLETFCGSPLYASPEIVTGEPYVGPEVDSWSLGVLLYALVYGTMPFDGRDYQVLTRQITNGSFSTPTQVSDAHGLITSMLTVDPKKRATIEEVAEHVWLSDVTSPFLAPTPPPPLVGVAEPVQFDVNDNLVEEQLDGTLKADEKEIEFPDEASPHNAQPKSILKRPEPLIEITAPPKISPRSKVVSDSTLAGQLAAVCGLHAKDSLKLKVKPQTASGKRRVLRTKRDRESGYYSSPERVSAVPDLISQISSSDTILHTPNTMPHIKSALATNARRKGAGPTPSPASRPPRAPTSLNSAKEFYLAPMSPPSDGQIPSMSSDDASSAGSLTRPASTYSDSSILSSDSFDMCNFNGAIFQQSASNHSPVAAIQYEQLQGAQSYPGTPTLQQRPVSLSLAPDTLPQPVTPDIDDEPPPSGTLTPKSEKLVRDLERILAPSGRRSGGRTTRGRLNMSSPRPRSVDSLGSNQLAGMMNQLNADLEQAYKKALDICVNLQSAEV